MSGSWRQGWIGRRWFIGLAAFALLVQLLAPPGFMYSGDASTPGLVICTGHGPLLSFGDHKTPAKAPKSRADAACGFAAHGASVGPPPLAAIARGAFHVGPATAVRAFDLASGRGLAAPPPPSHAPPARI